VPGQRRHYRAPGRNVPEVWEQLGLLCRCRHCTVRNRTVPTGTRLGPVVFRARGVARVRARNISRAGRRRTQVLRGLWLWLASPVPSIQSAHGNPNGGDKDKPGDGPGCASAVVNQGSANGSTNAAARGGAGHAEPSAESAAPTVAKSGNVRAPMPRDAEWCAESLIRAWKRAAFTPESLRRMETEFRKRLAENDWSSCSSSYLAMSDVKRLKEQVQREFGDYE